MDPLYVSHDDRVSNIGASHVSVGSPFMHHKALHVRGGGAFLCHKRTVVSDNTKYLIEGFMIVRVDRKYESLHLLLIE